MQTLILEGKTIAAQLEEELKLKAETQKKKLGRSPHLASLSVSDDKASLVYLKSQSKLAARIGIEYSVKELPPNISQNDLNAEIQLLNKKHIIDGVIIQMPLPAHLDAKKAINVLDPKKDAEGLHSENLGALFFSEAKIVPPTPAAVMRLLEATGKDLYGKEVVIVGHSEIVGKPLSLLLLNKFATVTVCHIGTSQAGFLEGHLRRAEILIVAVGKANFIKGLSLKEGVIVIDVGINRVEGKITGDVDFDSARERASVITPVPGGVGALTPVMLMKNLLNLVDKQL